MLSSGDNINRGQPSATVVSTVVSNLAFLCAAYGFFQCLRGFSPGTPVFQVNVFFYMNYLYLYVPDVAFAESSIPTSSAWGRVGLLSLV